MGQAFTTKYPGVRVDGTKTTSEVAFQRVMQDINGGAAQSDVFTTTDAGHMTYLIGKDKLVKYTAENAAGMVQSLRDFAKDGYYQVSWVGQVVLVYNNSKVTAAESPKDWPDLTDPKWKDKVTFGSPNYSGIVGVWTVGMENKYGWGYFEKLNKLNPLIGRSVDDAVTVLNSGERVVAAGNPASTLRSAAKGNPLVGKLSHLRHAGRSVALGHPEGIAQPERGETVHRIPRQQGIFARSWLKGSSSRCAPTCRRRKGAKSLAEITHVLADAGADREAASGEQAASGATRSPIDEHRAKPLPGLDGSLAPRVAAPSGAPAICFGSSPLLALLFLVGSPIVSLVLSSFRSTDTGAFTLDNYVIAYGRVRDLDRARQFAALCGRSYRAVRAARGARRLGRVAHRHAGQGLLSRHGPGRLHHAALSRRHRMDPAGWTERGLDQSRVDGGDGRRRRARSISTLSRASCW